MASHDESLFKVRVINPHRRLLAAHQQILFNIEPSSRDIQTFVKEKLRGFEYRQAARQAKRELKNNRTSGRRKGAYDQTKTRRTQT